MFQVPPKRRRYGAYIYSLYVLLAQTDLVYSKFKADHLSAKVRKIWVQVLTHLYKTEHAI